MKQEIQESSGVVDKTGTLPRTISGSVLARSAEAQWDQDGSTGFSYKTLFMDPHTGQETMLMKVDAGAVAPSHTHDKLEQVFVLEGDFYDEDRTYEPGDFIVRAPGAVHTGGTRNGALVLLIFSE